MLNLYDGDSIHNLGGLVYVNLRSSSITGAILGTSTPVFIPDHFFDITNFIFATPVTVTSGVTYFFQPVIQSGNAGVASYVTDGSYIGGTAIYGGVPKNYNLWFSEGVIVPEPSSASLILLGSGVLVYARCKKSFRT